MIEIKVNTGSWQNAERLGLSVSEISRRNLGADEVSLTKVISRNSEQMGITYGDTVFVRVDGVPVMQGLAQSPVRAFGAGNKSRSVRILGGWHHLSRVPFHRSIALNGIAGGVFDGALIQGGIVEGFAGMKLWLGTGYADATVGEDYEFTHTTNFSASPKQVDISGYVSNSGFIFPRYKIGGSVLLTTLYGQVSNLFVQWEAGFSRFSNEAPLLTPDLTELNAALNTPYPVYPRQQTVSDVTLDRVLQNALTIVPRCSSWVDYTLPIPQLHFSPLEDMPVSDLSGGIAMDGALSVRHDLVPTGVLIRYEKAKPEGDALQLAKGHAEARYVDKWPLGIQPNQPGVLVLSVPYPGEEEPLVGNLARMVYDQLTPARIAGNVVLGPLDAAQAVQWRPGRAITVSEDAETAGYVGVIQESTWNPASHTVRLSVGYPQAANVNTMKDLQSYLIESLSGKF